MRRGPGTRDDQSEHERKHDSQNPHRTHLGNAETGTHFALSRAAALEGSPIATPPCTTARACRRVAEATQ